jgi:hypothetical protein
MKLNTKMALLIAIGIFCIRIFSPGAGVIVSSIFATLLVWRLRASDFLPLLLLCITPTDFRGIYVLLNMPKPLQALNIGPFYLTTQLAISTAAVIKVTIEHRRFKVISDKFLLLLLFSATIPTAIICMGGRAEHNNFWTDPMRAVFTVTGFFYGILLVRKWDKPIIMEKTFVIVAIVLLAFANVMYFHHRLLWIYPALIPPIAAYFWIKKGYISGMPRFLPVVMVYLVVIFCIVRYLVSSIGVEEDKKNSTTFTLMGLCIFSYVLGIIAFLSSKEIKQFLSGIFGFPALLTTIIFVVIVANINQNGYTNKFGTRPNDLTLKDKITSKIYDDRARIWKANIDFIMEPPYFTKPAGRPVFFTGPDGRIQELTIGAHNSFIQAICLNGWYAGMVINILLCVFVIRCAKVLWKAKNPEVRLLAISVVVTGTYGAMTGQYALGSEIGFFFTMFAGLAYGATTKVYIRREPETSRNIPGGPQNHILSNSIVRHT